MAARAKRASRVTSVKPTAAFSYSVMLRFALRCVLEAQGGCSARSSRRCSPDAIPVRGRSRYKRLESSYAIVRRLLCLSWYFS